MAEASYNKDDVIEYLAERKFASTSNYVSFEDWRKVKEEIGTTLPIYSSPEEPAYIEELKKLEPDSIAGFLRSQLQIEDERRKAWNSAQDEGRFFSEPAAQADFDHWGKMTIWSVQEATALSLGKDPDRVSWAVLKDIRNTSPFAEQYRKRQDLLYRAVDDGTLTDPVRPSVVIEWSERIGLPIPTALRDAVEAAGQRVVDWTTLIAERNELRSQVVALQSSVNAAEKGLATRERNTLLKILISVAIKKYQYKRHHQRQPAPNNISATTVECGVSVSSDTVLDYLREAAQLLPAADEGK